MGICFVLITIPVTCRPTCLPSPDYWNENMCLELMLIAAAANT